MKRLVLLLCFIPASAWALDCMMVEKADQTEVVCVGDPAGPPPNAESQQPPEEKAAEQPAPPEENPQPEQPPEGEQADQPSQ